MEHDIDIVRGTTIGLTIVINDENGNPYTPPTGSKLIFGVKKLPTHGESECVVKKVADAVSSEVGIRISPDDTENLPFGKYFYDVGLRTGNDFYSIIPMSEFRINASITKRGDAV